MPQKISSQQALKKSHAGYCIVNKIAKRLIGFIDNTMIGSAAYFWETSPSILSSNAENGKTSATTYVQTTSSKYAAKNDKQKQKPVGSITHQRHYEIGAIYLQYQFHIKNLIFGVGIIEITTNQAINEIMDKSIFGILMVWAMRLMVCYCMDNGMYL